MNFYILGEFDSVDEKIMGCFSARFVIIVTYIIHQLLASKHAVTIFVAASERNSIDVQPQF